MSLSSNIENPIKAIQNLPITDDAKETILSVIKTKLKKVEELTEDISNRQFRIEDAEEDIQEFEEKIEEIEEDIESILDRLYNSTTIEKGSSWFSQILYGPDTLTLPLFKN